MHQGPEVGVSVSTPDVEGGGKMPKISGEASSASVRIDALEKVHERDYLSV